MDCQGRPPGLHDDMTRAAPTLPLAAFKWANEVDRAGAPVSPLTSEPMPLDFRRRRAALPLASWEVAYWSWVLRRGNGSEAAILEMAAAQSTTTTGKGGEEVEEDSARGW